MVQQQQHRKSFMIRDILFNCSDGSASSFDCNETKCFIGRKFYHEDEDDDAEAEAEDEDEVEVDSNDDKCVEVKVDGVSSSVNNCNCAIYSTKCSSNVWSSSSVELSTNCISCKQTILRKRSDWSVGCSDSYPGIYEVEDDADDDNIDDEDDDDDDDDEDIEIDSDKQLNCSTNDGNNKRKTIAALKRKMRRNRTVFTELQLMGLERRFDSQKYLSTPDRAELARILGLTQLQVKTWYQNRRMKWKKQVMQGGCPIPPTKPKGRPKKNSIPSLGINFVDATFLCSAAAAAAAAVAATTVTSTTSLGGGEVIVSNGKRSSSSSSFTSSSTSICSSFSSIKSTNSQSNQHQSIIHHHHQYHPHPFGQLTY